MQGDGRVIELVLRDGQPAAHIRCAPGLVPRPGQYLAAYAPDSEAALASTLFAAEALPEGFVAAAPIPSTWAPGTGLRLRGPLGRGFTLPASARRVLLVGWDCSPRGLRSLLGPALQQEAAVTLIANQIPDELPLQVEAQPPEALREACEWADFAALEVLRAGLPEMRQAFSGDRAWLRAEMQVLVHAPMPCGALAACGVCAVEAGNGVLLACDDGPVFDFRQLMGWSSRA